MQTAIIRGVSEKIVDCELTFLSRQTIDVNKAIRQHCAYQKCLVDSGFRVISLLIDHYLPDAVFVEDAAIVLDEIAIASRMGMEGRRQEVDSVANVLAQFRKIEFLRPPATLDGGDVMRIDRTLYVGLSRRTNRAAIDQVREIVKPYGYAVSEMKVDGCLHLKTGCSYLGRKTVLANTRWVDTSELRDLTVIRVPPSECWAANTLTVNSKIFLPASFPVTRELLADRGFRCEAIDISELQKAEAGLTCLSLIFEDKPGLRTE